MKYNPSGNLIWGDVAKSAFGDPQGTSISTDANGNIYMIGTLTGGEYAYIIFGNDTVTNLMSNDLFIAKYDSAGNAIWAESVGGLLVAGSSSLSTDGDGNSYMTGYFEEDSILFGNETLINVDGAANIFLVKYNSSGNVVWARTAGGEDSTHGNISNSVSADARGNVYITGWFEGRIIIFGNDTLTNPGKENIFIAKYNSSGNLIWAKSAGAIADFDFLPFNICTRPEDNAVITGLFSGTLTFGNDTLNIDSGSAGSFIVDYDSLGNVSWVKIINGGNTGICADIRGNVFVTGGFAGTISFGSDTLSNANGGMYVAKLSDDTTTGIPTLTNSNLSIRVYPNPTTGNIYFKGVKPSQTLQVYNLLGEEIFSSIINRDNYGINLGGKAKGMYFYRVADSNSLVQQGKIIVE